MAKVFSFSISPSNEHSGLISFRTDWLDLLAVQGTLKSLLQHHSSKASFLWCLAFLIVQLSYPYMTTGKTIALTRWTFVGKGPGSSLIAQLVKNPPAMQEIPFRFLRQGDSLEKAMANHFSILALRTPWTIWKVWKDTKLKDELPSSVGAQYATGD